MNINELILNSTTFDQLQQVIDTIRNHDSVQYFKGSQIKVGGEIVDISKIHDKICEIFDRLKSTKLKYDDLEKLASLLSHLQAPQESDQTIKQLFRQIFDDDSKIETIRSKCLESLKMLQTAPSSMKIEDCQTIASLQDLIAKMNEAQKEEIHHREKKPWPTKQLQSRLYVLYKNEVKRHPEKRSRIAFDTLLTIHQLNLIKPRSTKEITGIDVLEKKCIQTIREDKRLFNTLRNRYNIVAIENNDRIISKYLYSNVPSQPTIDIHEMEYLEKIVGIQNFLQYFNPDKSLISPSFNRDDPKEVKQCLELYSIASKLSNYIKKLPKGEREIENLKDIEYEITSLATHCAKILDIPVSLEQQFRQASFLPLQIPSHQNPSNTTTAELAEVLEEIDHSIQDVNHYMQFDSIETSNWREKLEAILPKPASDTVLIQKSSPYQEQRDDTLNQFVEDAVNQTMVQLDPLRRFSIFCKKSFLTINVTVPENQLKGTALENINAFKEELKKQAFDKILERIHHEFDSFEKVFNYVKSNYDLLHDILTVDGDLRTHVYAKLNELIDEEMLQELDPAYSSGFQQIFQRKISSTEGKKILQELKKRIEGVLDEKEFLHYLSSREISNKYILRLAYTALDLSDQCRWGIIHTPKGIERETSIREGRDRLTRYTHILWEAKDRDYKDSEHWGPRGEHFKHLFHEFYKLFFNKETQEIIWKAILEKCTTLDDYQLVLNLYRNSLAEEADVNKRNIKLARFYRIFPIEKYLKLNSFSLRDNDPIMPILLFIRYFDTHKMADLLLAKDVLSQYNQLTLRNTINDLEASKALTKEEIKTFRDNYDLPETST